MEKDLESLNEALERLQNSKARWKKTADGLKEWKEKDVTPNQTLWDIDRFVSGKITEGELERLQTSLTQIREELEEERQETDARLRAVKKEEKAARDCVPFLLFI
jgi:prefoldin subunit 5